MLHQSTVVPSPDPRLQCVPQAKVAEGGVLPGLVRLLQEGSGEGQEAAAKALTALTHTTALKASSASFWTHLAVQLCLEQSAHKHALLSHAQQSRPSHPAHVMALRCIACGWLYLHEADGHLSYVAWACQRYHDIQYHVSLPE